MKNLFTPRAPKHATPQEGATFSVVFPRTDYGQAPVIDLDAAIARVADEILRLRNVLASARNYRPANNLLSEIESTKAKIEVQMAARESDQAKARAGLIASKDVLPSLFLEEKSRDTLRDLHAELGQRTQANESATALERILEALR
jgi:hypothetical protein